MVDIIEELESRIKESKEREMRFRTDGGNASTDPRIAQEKGYQHGVKSSINLIRFTYFPPK